MGDALGEFGMERSLHARGIAFVEALDIVEGGLPDRGGFVGVHARN